MTRSFANSPGWIDAGGIGPVRADDGMPAVPAVKDPKWARTNIDKFVLANLEKQGLKPVSLANKHDLIRRATFDLTGLPPTPEETAAFEKDSSPDAFAKVDG